MSPDFANDNSPELARNVMQLLDRWRVEASDRVRLLGLPETTRPRALTRYRQDSCLPDEGDTLTRVRHFLAIEHDLGFLFPHNPSMADFWISTENPLFEDQTPLAVMLAEGLAGIERVAQRLGNGGDW
ncbi:MAG: DUF2384 domain-containing protein [Gammaproteobacteria bacterium]|nr:DUF2384 domain-containing protein [Gammaproteobacteria bacterium]